METILLFGFPAVVYRAPLLPGMLDRFWINVQIAPGVTLGTAHWFDHYNDAVQAIAEALGRIRQ